MTIAVWIYGALHGAVCLSVGEHFHNAVINCELMDANNPYSILPPIVKTEKQKKQVNLLLN
jgi:hypothetical protein